MNGWESKLMAPPAPDTPLRLQIDRLFEQQRSAWDLFRSGEAALAQIKTKEFLIDGRQVIVQANPGRSISTNAKVDPYSIARRPCFLCPDSLPDPERGVAFGDYIVLPNPYPVLQYHTTIACCRHEPQHLDGRIADLCALAKAAGPDLLILYNGPRCGASAPDHLHFQACSSGGIPLFKQLPKAVTDNRVAALALGGRNVITGSFENAGHAQSFIQKFVSTLTAVTGSREEPMFNIVALYRDQRYSIALFPRAKHRSACYFAEPPQRLSISPAAIEMAGIIVVADSTHFDRVTVDVVRSIYNEVTLGTDLFSRLAEAIT